MLNYLYYKLYQASLKSSLKDTPGLMTSISFGGLISLNILVVNAFLAKINLLPFLFSDKIQAGIFVFVIILFTMLYYNKRRYRLIQMKYSQENNKERIKGNIIIALYVSISFLSIFAVAFFRKGKL
ncbi:hypothetical protein RDV77_04895 [Porphyromonadaceae sp. NP-X]|nr:hypothetical protein [Porphyromonadaceae sp. NP-X]